MRDVFVIRQERIQSETIVKKKYNDCFYKSHGVQNMNISTLCHNLQISFDSPTLSTIITKTPPHNVTCELGIKPRPQSPAHPIETATPKSLYISACHPTAVLFASGSTTLKIALQSISTTSSSCFFFMTSSPPSLTRKKDFKMQSPPW